MLILELLIAIICGMIAGTITGITPGVHINLVSILLLSASGYLLGFLQPITLAVFIIAMAITHTYLDALPSIFLGAPDADQVLNVLPGHRLLLEGKGYEAVKLTVIGSFVCLIATIIFIPILIPVTPVIFYFVEPVMGWIMLVTSVYMILHEKGMQKKVWAGCVYMMAGILGIIVLTLPNLGQPLLPMLSGLFGISSLVMSLHNKVNIPEQKISEEISVSKKDLAKITAASTFSGGITGLFPGIGAAQAGIIGAQLIGNIGDYGYLILNGGINTVNFMFSLVTFYTLEKARNGAVLVILELVKKIDYSELLIFLAAALIVGSICVFLTLWFARKFSKLINIVNYKYMCISVIIFVSLLVFVFSGWKGLLVMVISTALGIIPVSVNVGRNHAMGCLLLPVTLFFLL